VASFPGAWFVRLTLQDAVQGLLTLIESVFAEAVVNMAAASVRLDEPGLPQDPKVLGNRSLRDVQPGDNSSDAQRMLLQKAQDPDPGPHGNSLQAMRQVIDIVRHALCPQY
jgi:hypothetical protein